jgi:hypothetical protein
MTATEPIAYMRPGGATSHAHLAQLQRAVLHQGFSHGRDSTATQLKLDAVLRTLSLAIDILSDVRCAQPLSQTKFVKFNVSLSSLAEAQPATRSRNTLVVGYHVAGSNTVETRILAKISESEPDQLIRLAAVQFTFEVKNDTFSAEENTTGGNLGIVIERISSGQESATLPRATTQAANKKLEPK